MANTLKVFTTCPLHVLILLLNVTWGESPPGYSGTPCRYCPGNYTTVPTWNGLFDRATTCINIQTALSIILRPDLWPIFCATDNVSAIRDDKPIWLSKERTVSLCHKLQVLSGLRWRFLYFQYSSIFVCRTATRCSSGKRIWITVHAARLEVFFGVPCSKEVFFGEG